MGEHRQEFQRELEAIEARVIELFAMVAEDLPTATQALLRGNNEAAQVLAERDQIIDALYTETHDLVVEIARQANHLLSEDLSPRSRGLVERMGNLASTMWRQAADAWYKRDRTAAFALEERDDEMDELHASLIAELASGRMTLPVTMEMTVVARLYERLGDHAVNIARRVVYLAGSNPKVAGPDS